MQLSEAAPIIKLKVIAENCDVNGELTELERLATIGKIVEKILTQEGVFNYIAIDSMHVCECEEAIDNLEDLLSHEEASDD